ncbi:hypothetical protein [Chroococcidiopsis cubana]|uniref:hypothetical protein n=1 Tax=Chroococcidiopsis cubana TaxID=171392 RepID=UPI0018F609A2|nr:hypothetical protein [Chroococcidiopsis cubana]
MLRKLERQMVRVERSFVWTAKFRRLVRDYERKRRNIGRFTSGCFRCSHAKSDSHS